MQNYKRNCWLSLMFATSQLKGIVVLNTSMNRCYLRWSETEQTKQFMLIKSLQKKFPFSGGGGGGGGGDTCPLSPLWRYANEENIQGAR